MSNNLFDDSTGIKDRIESWSKGIIGAVKSSFGISGGKNIMQDEIGKELAESLAGGIKKNSRSVIKSFNSMLEKIRYEKQADIISEDEYYKELEKLRDRYFAKGTQNWIKYTAQIYTYQTKKLREEEKQIRALYDDICEYAEDRLDEIVKKQKNFEENLIGVGQIYSKNTVTIDNRTDEFYTLRNLDADIAKINQYSDILDAVSKKADSLGINRDIKIEFLDEIKALDFSKAFGVLNALSAVTDEQFVNYLNAWDTKNRLSKSISSNSFAEEFEIGIDDSYENMKRVLEKAGYEIPEGFFTAGSLSAEKFGDAFIEEIEEKLETIRGIIANFALEMSASIDLPYGNTYNTSNTSYNITSDDSQDLVESIKRHETVKRLSGV